MADTEYPILVARFEGDQSLIIVCEDCGTEATLTAEQVRSEGDYTCPRVICQGWATYKYEQGDECPNCKTLAVRHEVKGHCSRACLLQTEYAEKLGERGKASEVRAQRSGSA